MLIHTENSTGCASLKLWCILYETCPLFLDYININIKNIWNCSKFAPVPLPLPADLLHRCRLHAPLLLHHSNTASCSLSALMMQWYWQVCGQPSFLTSSGCLVNFNLARMSCFWGVSTSSGLVSTYHRCGGGWGINCAIMGLYTAQCTVYSVHSAAFSVLCTVYIIPFTVHIILCTVYSIAPHTDHCSVVICADISIKIS